MKEYYGNNDWRDYQSLQHWKYISKKKVNGKWRYYYDVGAPGAKIGGAQGPDTPGSNIKSYSKLEDVAGKDEKEAYARSIIAYNRAADKRDALSKGQYGSDEYKKAEQEALTAGKAVAEAKARYYKTPIGLVDKIDDQIDNGRKFIANLFTKAAKAITPKEEYLDSLSKRNKR